MKVAAGGTGRLRCPIRRGRGTTAADVESGLLSLGGYDIRYPRLILARLRHSGALAQPRASTKAA